MSDDVNGKPQPPDDSWIPACFTENRLKFPPEELLKYAGKHIAWSWDGTHVVASADSHAEIFEKVKALGVNPSRVVYDYVDPPDTFCCGSAMFDPLPATPAGARPEPPDDSWIPACFGDNQQKVPPEELLKYSGKHIAWSWDGTHVVASADSDPELVEKVKALGLNPERVVYDYVDPVGEFQV